MFLRNDSDHLLDYAVSQSRQTTVIIKVFNYTTRAKYAWLLVPGAKIQSAN